MPKTGDRIVMMGKTKRAAPRDRAGVIEQVLNEDPPRYVIRWDSGGSTVLSPLPGAIRVEPKRRASAASARPPAPKAAAKPAAKAAKPGPKRASRRAS
jgi:hypothetical protein